MCEADHKFIFSNSTNYQLSIHSIGLHGLSPRPHLMSDIGFTARRYATACGIRRRRMSVRPSTCPSVTRRSRTKTAIL